MRHFMQRSFARIVSILLAACLMAGSVLAYSHSTGVQEYRSFDAYASGSSVVVQMEGYLPQWNAQEPVLTLNFTDGTSRTLRVRVADGAAYVMDENWNEINGTRGSANMNPTSDWQGVEYDTVFYLPESLLGTSFASMTLAGVTMTAAELGFVLEETQPADSGEAQSADNGETQPTDSGETQFADSTETQPAAGGGETQPAEQSEAETPQSVSEEPAQTVTEQSIQAVSLTPNASGRITVDGDDYDWTNITGMNPGDDKVTEWKAVRDVNGNVYLCFTGTAVSEWDYDVQWKNLYITQNGQTQNPQFANFAYIDGAELKIVNQANGTTEAPYCVELMIPASYFTDPNFTLAFGNNSIPAANIKVVDGVEVAPPAPAVYNGITVDGTFHDWDAVQKYPANDPNYNGSNLSKAAMVYDGDMVYIYLEETPSGSATGAGRASNGSYCITSDLGNMMNFELRNGDEVNGPAGAYARHVGKQWEIAIPASALPEYSHTISFGLYMEEPMVSGIANLTPEEPKGSFNGAVIDGNYDDWKFFDDVRLIEYANQGNQTVRPDSHGSLYTDGAMVYGHVFTNMPNHLQEKGGEFLAAISIAFNGDREYKGLPELGNLYPKVFMQDGSGNITVLNDGTRLAPGTYHFYISDTRSQVLMSDPSFWDTQVFGDMYVTIRDDQGGDQMEFQIDLTKVAAYTGQDPNDFKLVEAQFGKLGQEWISSAGSSSGPWLGVGLCCSTVAGAWIYRKKKEEVAG